MSMQCDVSIAQLEEMLLPTDDDDDGWLPLVKVRVEKGAEPLVRFRFQRVDGSRMCDDVVCGPGEAVQLTLSLMVK